MASRLEELQKAALPTTGLVPMQMIVPLTPYAEKQVVGFPPEVALKYEQAGAAEVYSGGDEAPNVTGPRAGSFAPAPVPGPHSATGSGVAAIRSSLYENRPEVTPRAQAVSSANPGDSTTVEPAQLPEEWREFSAVQIRELAAVLSGKAFVELSQDEATQIVEAAEAGKRVGRGDFGIEGDPRAHAHAAGGDEAHAEGVRSTVEARTDQPEVETRARRPRKTEE
jgi:hypothetical protein